MSGLDVFTFAPGRWRWLRKAVGGFLRMVRDFLLGSEAPETPFISPKQLSPLFERAADERVDFQSIHVPTSAPKASAFLSETDRRKWCDFHRELEDKSLREARERQEQLAAAQLKTGQPVVEAVPPARLQA